MRSETLAERLRVLRAKRGLGLVEAADRIGVERHTLRDLERGDRPNPRHTTLEKIARFYGVPVEVLLVPALPLPQEEESPAPLPQAPSPSSEEERRITRRVRAEELEAEASRLKNYNDRRQRQIDEYDEEEASLPEHGWWTEAAALEHTLLTEYEERGILGFVEAVTEDHDEQTGWDVHRACVKFQKERSRMHWLVYEVRTMVAAAGEQAQIDSISGPRKVEEWLRFQQRERHES